MSEATDTFVINVDVNIERRTNETYTGDRMSVRETVKLGGATFEDVAAVLRRFHDLGARIRAEAEGPRVFVARSHDVDQADEPGPARTAADSSGQLGTGADAPGTPRTCPFCSGPCYVFPHG